MSLSFLKNSNHFSCNLVEDSKKHLAFLKTLHLSSISTQKPSSNAFRRYSELWLPLVLYHSSSSNETDAGVVGLIPPADIAWLWHCHRLAPYRYAKYLQCTFSFHHAEANKESIKGLPDAFDPEYPFVVQFEDDTSQEQNLTFDATKHSDSAEYTKKLWKQMYPSEPFFANIATSVDMKASHSSDQVLDSKLSGFDVIGSCQRQVTFLWQVSQVSFQHDSFLEQGVENYFKFMTLMKRDEDRPYFLVPTYQIDLMWHTHMLSSIKRYHKDCMNIINRTLEHDDSLTDRSSGGILDTNFQATKSLWLDVYSEEYKVPGGMYRGEPPKEFFHKDWLLQESEHQQQKGHIQEKDTVVSMANTFVFPGVSLTHLIGKVGASSVGRDENSELIWMNIDYPEAFISGQPHSNGTENPIKDMYVFGKGVKGIGYYHLHTREAYQVILTRIEGRKSTFRQEVCCRVLCCFQNAGALGGIPLISKEIKKMEAVEKITILRMNAVGPNSQIDVPPEILEEIKKSSKRNNTDAPNDGAPHHHYYGGTLFFNGEVAATGGAAGCGGGKDGKGAGCGGGGDREASWAFY